MRCSLLPPPAPPDAHATRTLFLPTGLAMTFACRPLRDAAAMMAFTPEDGPAGPHERPGEDQPAS